MTASIAPTVPDLPARPAAWCPAAVPRCPCCGQRLYVAVDRNQTMRGICRNRQQGKRCEQHYVAVGIGGDVTIVLALSPSEAHDLASGRKLAGITPETVTWANG